MILSLYSQRGIPRSQQTRSAATYAQPESTANLFFFIQRCVMLLPRPRASREHTINHSIHDTNCRNPHRSTSAGETRPSSSLQPAADELLTSNAPTRANPESVSTTNGHTIYHPHVKDNTNSVRSNHADPVPRSRHTTLQATHHRSISLSREQLGPLTARVSAGVSSRTPRFAVIRYRRKYRNDPTSLSASPSGRTEHGTGDYLCQLR